MKFLSIYSILCWFFEITTSLNISNMSSYQINIPSAEFVHFLGNTKPDASSKNSSNLVGTEWFEPICKRMKVAEDLEDLQIQVDKSRLYEVSKKKTNFLSINCHCKICAIKYAIVLKNKPDSNAEFIFDVEKSAEHDRIKHETKKMPVRGQQREDLAKSILLNEGGSSKSYYDSQIGLNLVNVPSRDVMKKCVSEFVNKEMVSTNWITNILHQSDLTNVLIKGKCLNGYVHNLNLANHFSMTLELESQYVALHKLPLNRRILHMDATGRLIKIPNYMKEYSRILTYAFIAQDLDKLSNETSEKNSNYLLLSETSTSKHDTSQISSMFLNLVSNFYSLYPLDHLCYMLVLDLSWASIHAAVKQLNNETFSEYNNRVLRMASSDMTAFIPSKVELH